MTTALKVFVGWDPREQEAYDVAEYSLRRRASVPVEVVPLQLHELQRLGIMTRPIERKPSGGLWCPISQAPMSTEFAISRFAVPLYANRLGQSDGWVLFTDCDMLWQADVAELFECANPKYAIRVVKHEQKLGMRGGEKMDGQLQTHYARKNWSSVMLWNLGHASNKRLSPSMLNQLPGRDLHRFCWLADDEIGSLPFEWNVLVEPTEPKLLHYTLGGPWFPGYEKCAYSGEWLRERDEMRRDHGA